MEYLITILLLYIIYRLHSESKKGPKIYMKGNNFGEDVIIGETPKESYNPYDKDEVLQKVKKSFSDRDKFFDDDSFNTNDKEILKNIEFAFDNPKSKEHLIFHGGCITCNSPKEKGLGRCRGCQYFTADWNLPDLIIEN